MRSVDTSECSCTSQYNEYRPIRGPTGKTVSVRNSSTVLIVRRPVRACFYGRANLVVVLGGKWLIGDEMHGTHPVGKY